MNKNFFSEILMKVKLTLRLIKDTRVNSWYKLIPAFCLLYLIVPVDILIGPLDDAVVMYIGMDLFIDFCPPEVVEEHRRAILGQSEPAQEGEVIDAEFKE